MNPVVSRVTCFVASKYTMHSWKLWATNTWDQMQVMRELGDCISSLGQDIYKQKRLFLL